MAFAWLTIIAYFSIHIGFSAFLGTQVFHLRNSNKPVHSIAVLISASIILLSPLSLPLWGQWLSWVLAVLTSSIFTLRPKSFPPYLWSMKFALAYLSGTMLLVAIWEISQGIQLHSTLLSSLAALACILAWVRSFQKIY